MSNTRHKSLKRLLAGALTAAVVAAGSFIGVVAPASAAETPTLSVSEAPRAGGTVSVQGAGFSTSGNGVYLGLRETGNSIDIETIWVAVGNELGSIPMGATAPMNPDGTFTVAITAPAFSEGLSYEVHTRQAHGGGSDGPSQTTSVALVYAADETGSEGGSDDGDGDDEGSEEGSEGSGEEGGSGDGEGTGDGNDSGTEDGSENGDNGEDHDNSTSPVLAVSKSEGLNPEGEVVTVTGTGYDIEVPMYVTLCSDVPLEELSFGFISAGCVDGAKLVTKEPSTSTQVPFNEDGSFEFEMTLTPRDGAEKTSLYSLAYHRAADNRTQDAKVVLEFSDASAEVDGEGDEGEDEGSNDDEAVQAAGDLLWAFKDSWNNYLFSPWVNGTATASDGASVGDDHTLGFVQTESDYDPETGLGIVKFTGTVVYASSLHGFTIALKNPWIVFSAEGATLSAEVSNTDQGGASDTSRITVAHLDSVDPVENSDGSFTWNSVTGVFDENLQPGGWSRYSGEEIAPLTFTVGADVIEPVSPPAVELSTRAVKQGDKMVFTGTGFEAGAKVDATIYSAPISLPAQTANADGQVVFNWNVPADFETGQHRIELAVDGEVLATQTFTVEAADAVIIPGANQTDSNDTEEDVCVARSVTGGSMNWGLKTSFRNYLSSPVANGTFSGGSFGASSGAVNVEDAGIGRIGFGGSINASGHGGLLNFQLSNPSVQITGAGSAILYASVSSTKPDGSPAVNGTVAFANLSFSGPAIDSNTLSVSGASATLTGAGASAFGGFYNAGDALDAVSFSVNLGDEIDCDETTDPAAVAELATTGADSAPAMLSFAALALLFGAALVFTARRRTARVTQ